MPKRLVVVALLALWSAPASSAPVLELGQGWVLLSDDQAMSPDGAVIVRQEQPSLRGLPEAKQGCLALPLEAKAKPEDAAVRVGAPLDGKAYTACVMKLRLSAETTVFAASVAVAGKGELALLTVLLDGEPDRWTRARIKKTVDPLVKRVRFVPGEVEAPIRVPADLVPPVSMGCGRQIRPPTGWSFQTTAQGGGVLSDGSRLERSVSWFPVLPTSSQMQVQVQMQLQVITQTLAALVGPENVEVEQQGEVLVVEGANAEWEGLSILSPRPACGGALESILLVGRRDGSWSPGHLMRRFLAAEELPGVSPDEAAAPFRARPGAVPQGSQSNKPADRKAVAAWVKSLAGSSTSSGSHGNYSGGGPSDGYSLSQSQGLVVFCEDGSFLSMYSSSYSMSTEFGSGASHDQANVGGQWGVFERDGGLFLQLWTPQGSFQHPLPRQPSAFGPVIPVGAVPVNLGQLRRGTPCR